MRDIPRAAPRHRLKFVLVGLVTALVLLVVALYVIGSTTSGNDRSAAPSVHVVN